MKNKTFQPQDKQTLPNTDHPSNYTLVAGLYYVETTGLVVNEIYTEPAVREFTLCLLCGKDLVDPETKRLLKSFAKVIVQSSLSYRKSLSRLYWDRDFYDIGKHIYLKKGLYCEECFETLLFLNKMRRHPHLTVPIRISSNPIILKQLADFFKY